MLRFLREFVWVMGVWAAVGAQAQAPAGGVNPGKYAAMMSVQVEVPNFKGMTVQEAQAANMLVSTTKGAPPRLIFSSLKPLGPTDGVVETQVPLAGTTVYPGRQAATLTMQVAQTTVPPLKGMSVVEARSRLGQSSLLLGRVSGEKSKGTSLSVATQTPAAGTSVEVNSAVDVVLEAAAGVEGSSGAVGASGASGAQGTEVVPPEVRVPDVLKLGAGAAAERLAGAGLAKPVVLGPADGVVVLQRPEAESLAGAGTQVRLTMGIQEHTILIPPQPAATAWGWWAAGGVVLLGSLLAIGYGMRSQTPIDPELKQGPVAAVVTVMVTKMNPATAKVTMKSDPALRWRVRLRDRPVAGKTVVKSEIEGVLRGEV